MRLQGALPAGWAAVDGPGDDPTHPASFVIDNEGSETQRVGLVQDGIVRTLLMSRVPRKDIPTGTNGHARGSLGSRAAGRVSMLEVTPERRSSAGDEPGGGPPNLDAGMPHPRGGEGPSLELPRVAVAPRGERRQDAEGQASPTALLAAILARLDTATSIHDGMPGWLVEAIGNPLTYDAAGSRRKDVCARVEPTLYRRLQAMKERLGLRTTAGAWEYVLRAGLAVGEHGVAANPGWSRGRV